MRRTFQSIKKDFFHTTAFHILLIAVIGLLAYSDTFSVPFQWDEDIFLRENPIVRNLDYFLHPSKAVGLPFHDAFVGRYIGYLTFAINYRFHAFSVTGFHIVNISIHLISAMLVYCFVLLTFKSPFMRDSGTSGSAKYIALGSSLLFVAHPVQTEAITYIFQRLASLVTMFYLLSVVAYIKFRLMDETIEHRSKSRYLFYMISLISAVLAMKTKENAFTLPIIIALHEFCFFSPSPRASASPYPRVCLSRRIFYLAPLLMTLCIIPLTYTGTSKPLHKILEQVATVEIGFTETPRWAYLFTQFRVIVTYLRLLVLPINQNLDYDYPLYKSFFTPQVMVSFLLLAALFGLGIYLVLKTETETRTEGRGLSPCFRLIGFGILWFFITLSVESSIIPVPMLIDEYRVYLPSIGFFIAMCTLLFIVARRISIENRMMVLLFSLIVALLFGLTYMRNAVWCDSFVLWQDVARKSPGNVRAFNNLGTGYLGIHESDKAIEMFNKALALKPDYTLAWHNRGEAYLQKKDYDRALKDFDKADSLQKNYLTYLGRGKAFLAKGDPDEALKNFLKALVMNPTSDKTQSCLAIYYASTGKYSEAIQLFSKVLHQNPYSADSYINRGKVYTAQKQYGRAVADFAAAVRLNPLDMDALYNCALVYYYAGQYDYAIREYSAAISLNSTSAALYEGRGLSFYNKKDVAHAIEDYTKAIELNPGSAVTYSNRGIAWSDKGDYDRAIADFTKAIEIKRDFSWAYMNRGVAYKMVGSVDRALADFNKTLSLAPRLAVAYTNRGDLYFEQGIKSKALSDFRKGCSLKDASACSRLGRNEKKQVMGERPIP